jgi:hypothetical protein
MSRDKQVRNVVVAAWLVGVVGVAVEIALGLFPLLSAAHAGLTVVSAFHVGRIVVEAPKLRNSTAGSIRISRTADHRYAYRRLYA